MDERCIEEIYMEDIYMDALCIEEIDMEDIYREEHSRGWVLH